MQISSRFTIAIHMLTCMETFKEDYKITSDFLASSINVNPVIIRRILSQLRDAGMIEVKRGTGGASVIKPLSEITFLDIYQACPVGKNIHNILDDKLLRVQQAMERELASITLEDVMEDLGKYL